MKNIQDVQKKIPSERVSKVIARAGVASRREVERMIDKKRVKVNGVYLERSAVNVTANDYIEVDDKPLRAAERTRLWLYYKPIGLVTTHFDPAGRNIVFDNLPSNMPRVVSIGRLDINTEGLLLLTNDGGLSRVLELPTTQWLRVYRVRAYGKIDQSKFDELKEGIVINGVCYRGINVTIDSQKGSNIWCTVGLREGKNREIKNVFEYLHLKVNRLIRISYGPFQLGELSDGDIREVSSKVLIEQLGSKLANEARVNFDAPIYNFEPLIIKNDDKLVETVDKTINISKKLKNNNKNDQFNKKTKVNSLIKRRNRSSNVWMSPGIHAPIPCDRKLDDNGLFKDSVKCKSNRRTSRKAFRNKNRSSILDKFSTVKKNRYLPSANKPLNSKSY
ncbi:pseudouridine synthase [Candidatus Liberibacter americanus]|uniref:Pseudouridine synthase n=1 Tax=Candidatus Liberibacter americanus str. Sao Paulo TaxID=1261131 RepID=U6B716_9HYPH|nr:ribosomal large subunit pseudouridine synthase B [Candidatus Liberibacter americanus str. Sao Paulo]EMS36370.1 ribosomal large subunit pseudouridine synthase B [Candidatus Liberibacter americanus PW_SP]